MQACDTDDERGISKDEWMAHFIIEQSKASANEAAATFGVCFEVLALLYGDTWLYCHHTAMVSLSFWLFGSVVMIVC